MLSVAKMWPAERHGAISGSKTPFRKEITIKEKEMNVNGKVMKL